MAVSSQGHRQRRNSVLVSAVPVGAALSGRFLTDVELSANGLAEAFDGDQSGQGTNLHIKSFS